MIQFLSTTDGSSGGGPDTAGLSGRESQILALAANGLLDKQISIELGITQNTLRTYWRRIRAKLGDGTRSMLVAALVRTEKSRVGRIDSDNAAEQLAKITLYYETALARCRESEVKTHRALRVLRELLVEMRKGPAEEQLVQSACRILVEVGGYMMAWVGYPVDDAAQSIKPMAQFGDTHGYLASIKVSWGDNELGRGPSGRALRTGKVVTNRDFLVDPTTAPWRRDAARSGFHSSIALPIRDGTPHGVLMTYAPEPDAFDEREVALLEEFALNLAYAISAARTQPRPT